MKLYQNLLTFSALTFFSAIAGASENFSFDERDDEDSQTLVVQNSGNNSNTFLTRDDNEELEKDNTDTKASDKLFSSMSYASNTINFSEIYFGENDPDTYSMSLFNTKNIPESTLGGSDRPEDILPYLNTSITADLSVCYNQTIVPEETQKIISYKARSTKEEEKDVDYYVVTLSTRTTPKFATFLGKLLGHQLSNNLSFCVTGGLIIFPQTKKDAVIFTFGDGKKSLLHPLGIVQNWGRNLVASKNFFAREQVKEIEHFYYRNSIPSIKKERSSRLTDIEKFGIEVGSEEIEVLRIRPHEDYKTKKLFRGQDSLTFGPSKNQCRDNDNTLLSLKKIGDYFYKYYQNDHFAIHPILRQFIDEKVKDKKIKKALDQELLKIMQQGGDEAESCIFLHDDAFRIVGGNIRFERELHTFEFFLKNISKSLQTIHSPIDVSQNGTKFQTIPFSRLVFSLPLEYPEKSGKFYRFGRGDWLEVDAKRFESIKEVLRQFKVSKEDLKLPGYCIDDIMGETNNDYKEIRYNKRAVDSLNKSSPQSAYLIDRYNISLGEGRGKFEFGDIFLKKDGNFYIIHVKRDGAGKLSHQREQVERSAEYLSSCLDKRGGMIYPYLDKIIGEFYERYNIARNDKKNNAFTESDVKKILKRHEKNNDFNKVEPGSKNAKERQQKLDFKKKLQKILQDKKSENFRDVFYQNISALIKILGDLYVADKQNKVCYNGYNQTKINIPDEVPPSKGDKIEFFSFLEETHKAIQKDLEIFGSFFKNGLQSKEVLNKITFVLAVIDDRGVDKKLKEELDKLEKDKQDSEKEKNEKIEKTTSTTKKGKHITKEQKNTIKKERPKDFLENEDFSYCDKKNPLFQNQDLWGLDHTRVSVQKKGFQFKICVTNEEAHEDYDAFGTIKPSNPDSDQEKKKRRRSNDSSYQEKGNQNTGSPSKKQKPHESDSLSSGDEVYDNSTFIQQQIKPSFDEEFLESLPLVTEIDTSKAQRFPFPNSNAENVQDGQCPEYWSVPTIGDGDCFFHAVFTEDGETKEDVQKKAKKMRNALWETINNGEYLDDLKPLIYEHYIGLLTNDKNNQRVPESIRNMVKEKNKYAKMYNSMQHFQISLNAIPKAEEKFPDDDIKNLITPNDITTYMEQFRTVDGEDSYIPFRKDMRCPVDLLATIGKKRIKIFTFNATDQVLQLYKMAGTEGTIIYILHDNNHFVRLYKPADGEDYKKQCEQIYKNYKKAYRAGKC